MSQFLVRLFAFLVFICFNVLHILDINILSDVKFVKIFSPILWTASSQKLWCSLSDKSLFHFMNSCLTIVITKNLKYRSVGDNDPPELKCAYDVNVYAYVCVCSFFSRKRANVFYQSQNGSFHILWCVKIVILDLTFPIKLCAVDLTVILC